MTDPRFEAGTRFSDEEIAEIERALGRHLPEDYREFVRTYGNAFVGGSVDGSDNLPILSFFRAGYAGGILDVLDRYDDLERDPIKWTPLFGKIARQNKSLERRFESTKTHHALRNDSALPFARDELGNIYVQNSSHTIFYINYYGGITSAEKIADNFGNFLSRIVVADA